VVVHRVQPVFTARALFVSAVAMAITVVIATITRLVVVITMASRFIF
jgi:hypothetical protein